MKDFTNKYMEICNWVCENWAYLCKLHVLQKERFLVSVGDKQLL